MAYTGYSEDHGIIRAINQLFVLKHNYELSIDSKNKEPFDEYKADVYKQTIASKKCGSLCLLFIRNSDDSDLIKTSEYNGMFFN